MASGCSYHFPQDLIFEILSYLPVKSLLRFRSVCKSWLSIISDQQFIDTHLTNSQKKPATLVLLDRKFYHLYLDTLEESVRLHVTLWVRWICSCNGLVCLVEQCANVVYLWNPLSRQLKKLCVFPEGRGEAIDFVFVYDSTCDDYKLLRFSVEFRLTFGADYCDDLIADMYSLKTGNFKELKVPADLGNIELYTNSKCVHDLKTGVLYFECAYELLSFDLDKEVFRAYHYPLPEDVQYPISDVLDFEGSAAVIFKAVDGSGLSLWTLDNVCDDKVAWTKKFNIEGDVKIDRVYIYLGAGQFVAKADDGHIFYDYKKKDVKKLLSPAPVGWFSSLVKYTESLVSPEGFQEFELLK